MSDFKAKMHQIRFRLGLCPRPAGGAYSAPPDPLAGFKGPTSKGRGGKGEEGREGLGLKPPPKLKYLATSLYTNMQPHLRQSREITISKMAIHADLMPTVALAGRFRWFSLST